MEQLQQAVTDSFAKILATGAIEQIIEKELAATVSKIFNEELRSYSDFGKGLTEYIKSALKVDFDHLGLPGYNDFILKVVRAQVDANINNVLAGQVNDQLAALLAPPPTEITLSALVADFIEFNKRDDCGCDTRSNITLILEEPRHGMRWVSLDADPDVKEHETSIRFLWSDWNQTIGGLRINKKEMDKYLFVGPIYGFERKLFQMHIAGTKLIIDQEADDIDTHYPGSY